MRKRHGVLEAGTVQGSEWAYKRWLAGSGRRAFHIPNSVSVSANYVLS